MAYRHEFGASYALSLKPSIVPIPLLPCSSSNADEIEIKDEDKNVERGNWTGKLDYLLSMLGYAIGLSAAWRFPYLCYRNGGGAFLIPYFIMIFACGIPLFFMETALGQFTSLGALKVYKISPIFKGTGYATVFVCIIQSVYYNVIISYIFFYLGASFTSELPWETCGHSWNTENCTTTYRTSNFKNFSLENGTFNDISTPTNEFFYRYVLNISSGIHDIGEVNWRLAICLSVAWIVIYLCLIRGVKSTGKVVYFTATFPYVVLLVLTIHGLTLPGAFAGITYYIKPEFSTLKNFSVWGDAALQVFYSLGPGWGGLVTMASFNRFYKNCYREAIIVPIVNVLTAVWAGFVVFAVLGYLSHQTGIPIDKVATGGPGLAFIVYPEALTLLPFPPIWSCLFFFMMLTLGVDSQFVTIETVIAAVWDELPKYLREKRSMLAVIICVIMFLLGQICITRGGMYVLQLLDWYSAALTVILICIVECLIIGWIYGVNNFARDVEFMTKTKISLAWRCYWKFISPAILIVILALYIFKNKPVNYGNYEYPNWAVTLGWCIAATSMFLIPLYMIYKFCVTPGSLRERIKIFHPSKDYGPALPKHYREWKAYCELLDQNKAKTEPMSAFQLFTPESKNLLENRNSECL